MKAIVLHRLGEPDVLCYEDVPDPQPGAGQVLIRLKAAALNRRDISLRKRSSTAGMLPLIPGSDGAGVIAALGQGVTAWAVGQAVVINPALNWGTAPHRPGPDFCILGGPDPGTYAEQIVVPAENVFLKPVNLTFEEAAACPVAALTAWRALITHAGVGPGDRVLLPGIGSGVATFALQIAKLAGAAVYVTSHSDDKLEKARQLGADGVANYQTQDWRTAIRGMTQEQGVDVVVDSVGTRTFAAVVELLAPGGRLVTLGATSGAAAELDLRQVYSRHLSVLGTTLGNPWEFEQVLRVLATGQIKPVIDSVFPLAEAAEAQRYLESAAQFGKVVLAIEGEVDGARK